MHQADDRQDQGTEPDADTTAGLGVLGMAQQAQAEPQQDERHDEADPPERTGDDRVHHETDLAAQTPPLDRGHHDGQADQGQADAVAAVRRVEVAGARADPARQPADQVGEAEPDAAQAAADPAQDDGADAGGPGGAPAGCGLAPSGPAGRRAPARGRPGRARRS